MMFCKTTFQLLLFKYIKKTESEIVSRAKLEIQRQKVHKQTNGHSNLAVSLGPSNNEYLRQQHRRHSKVSLQPSPSTVYTQIFDHDYGNLMHNK